MANAPEPASYFKLPDDKTLSDERWRLLVHQLIDFLGIDLVDQVSDGLRNIEPCESRDSGTPCICPALLAYGALYESGFAIVPVADARMLWAMRGSVN